MPKGPESSGHYSTPINNVVPFDYSAYKRNNYTSKPSTSNGDSTEFEWWKSKVYTRIRGLGEE